LSSAPTNDLQNKGTTTFSRFSFNSSAFFLWLNKMMARISKMKKKLEKGVHWTRMPPLPAQINRDITSKSKTW
jgi:hypothetical protein